MPKEETTAEFQKRTFPARARKVKRDTAKALDPFTRSTPEQKARATKAGAAADRVLTRMGEGKPAERAAATKPGTPKSTPETRQRAVEKAAGTSGTQDALRAVGDIAKKAQKNKENQ